jgi:hypothetical protein
MVLIWDQGRDIDNYQMEESSHFISKTPIYVQKVARVTAKVRVLQVVLMASK